MTQDTHVTKASHVSKDTQPAKASQVGQDTQEIQASHLSEDTHLRKASHNRPEHVTKLLTNFLSTNNQPRNNMEKVIHISTSKESRARKVRRIITAQLADLLDVHFSDIENDAVESQKDTDKPVTANVSVAVQWEAGSMNPKIKTKIAWTVKHQDETEEEVDILQMGLNLGGEQ